MQIIRLHITPFLPISLLLGTWIDFRAPHAPFVPRFVPQISEMRGWIAEKRGSRLADEGRMEGRKEGRGKERRLLMHFIPSCSLIHHTRDALLFSALVPTVNYRVERRLIAPREPAIFHRACFHCTPFYNCYRIKRRPIFLSLHSGRIFAI